MKGYVNKFMISLIAVMFSAVMLQCGNGEGPAVSEEDVTQVVIEQVALITGTDASEITVETNLAEDLGATEEDISDIVLEIGYATDVNLPGYGEGAFETVGDLVEFTKAEL